MRLITMRPPKALLAALLSVAVLTGACSDDDKADVDAGDSTDQDDGIGAAPDGSGVAVPDRAPELVGTITTVTPFEPVTEDCTPPDEGDPDDSVSSDDPPVCTPEDNDIVGTVLVEEDPDDPQGGRKISYTVTTDTKITGDGVGVFADLAEGQAVDTWTTGMCAESYPEQCGLEAIRVTG